MPTSHVALDLDLRGLATRAIDLFDERISDLGSMLPASRVGAGVEAHTVQIAAELAAQQLALPRERRLGGGDGEDADERTGARATRMVE